MLRTLIDTKCHFAIKSGGHDRTPGSSNADGGVTIDLARLNQVQVAKDRKSVRYGAGSRWQDVYTALEQEGLMVVGGRVAGVGVGGLTLGGECDPSISVRLSCEMLHVLMVNQGGSHSLPIDMDGPVITFSRTKSCSLTLLSKVSHRPPTQISIARFVAPAHQIGES